MKWVLIIIFSFFGLLALGKGIELWMALGIVDISGIEIYFLGIEINANVEKTSIPGYALGFSIASLIPFLVAGSIVIKSTIKKENKLHRG